MEIRPKTIFCDIDGTLVEHSAPDISSKLDYKLKVLKGTIDKFLEWDRKGYKIILTTGRKESLRAATEKQLSEAGIFYDLLIMGIGGGVRVLINDVKPDGQLTCECYNLERNSGISNLEL